MDFIEDKFIRSSKERFCGICGVSIPKDTTHVFQTWVNEETETYCIMRICRTCDCFSLVERIEEAWTSSPGTPVDYINKETLFTTRFSSEAIQNYISGTTSDPSDNWYRAELQRRFVSNDRDSQLNAG